MKQSMHCFLDDVNGVVLENGLGLGAQRLQGQGAIGETSFLSRFSPISSSWLDMIERLFRSISADRLECDVFSYLVSKGAMYYAKTLTGG